jgi:hypothetical protein
VRLEIAIRANDGLMAKHLLGGHAPMKGRRHDSALRIDLENDRHVGAQRLAKSLAIASLL